MKTITFITRNEKKLNEVKAILKGYTIEHIEIDLPELQGERNHVVKEKARSASKQLKRTVIVDDTNLCFNALNGLPGPYIRDFLEKIGVTGLYKLLAGFEDKTAKAICMVGYCEPKKEPVLFEGIVEGTIVEPKQKDCRWWDAIFKPKGSNKTYLEMTNDEKNRISHRKKAFEQLREYLENESE
jgi:inosine triphosphate pyrophosphatase